MRSTAQTPRRATPYRDALATIEGTAVLLAAALISLARSPALGRWTLAEALPLLLGVLAACLALGGLLAAPRLRGQAERVRTPAARLREAVAGMRRGDYGCRLALRHDDALGDLAAELDGLRDELARRDVALARLRHRLGDGARARGSDAA
jgi:hypothetical protein